jgi:RNA polymerase sigma-70 factor (ECF subfamily)
MSFFTQIDIAEDFPSLAAYRAKAGFIPSMVLAQASLPRLMVAQTNLEAAVLLSDGDLSRVQKEQIALVVAASRQDAYSVRIRGNILNSLGIADSHIDRLLRDYRQAGLSPGEVTLMDFCLKLSHYAPWISVEDIERLSASGFEEGAIHEAVLATGYSSYLCVMSAGLGLQPDFQPRELPQIQVAQPAPSTRSRGLAAHNSPRDPNKKSFLHPVYRSPKTFEPFVLILKSHGFIPNFFRAQTARPDLIGPEAEAIVGILLPEDVLCRRHKEYLLLVISAANLNSYCVAAHCNLLRGLGITPEEGDQIAVDYREANLPDADTALLDFAMKLAVRPSEFRREDIDRLLQLGFSEEQILESVAVIALNNFANTVQMGLGIEPDFEPPPAFERKKLHLMPPEGRPTGDGAAGSLATMAPKDPDASLVVEAQGGGLDAFETLVRRHSRTVYRTLMAILGDPEGAQDAMQDVFLSAFKNIARFQGRSKFSTWLISIARNTALQRLRDHKIFESLDETPADSEVEFRPRQVRDWSDNPEQMYSAAETRLLVEKGVMQLPAKYRVVLVLRDIEQLSTEEVALNLGLSVPAIKARLLRGRLMLREALSPYFTASAGRVGA